MRWLGGGSCGKTEIGSSSTSILRDGVTEVRRDGNLS